MCQRELQTSSVYTFYTIIAGSAATFDEIKKHFSSSSTIWCLLVYCCCFALSTKCVDNTFRLQVSFKAQEVFSSLPVQDTLNYVKVQDAILVLT